MTFPEWLARLLLWPRPVDGEIESVAWRTWPFLGGVGTAAALLALALLGLWSFQALRHNLPWRRRAILFALRLLAVVTLIPALLSLSMRLDLRSEVRPELAIAVDASRSMTLRDAGGAVWIEGATRTTRLEAVQEALLAGDLLERLERDAEVRLWSVADRAAPLDGDALRLGVRGLAADGDSTNLTAALGEIASSMRARTSAGIVLISDGRHNTGGSPARLAPQWRDTGMRIHAVVAGDEDPKDIEIVQVFADSLLFADDPATVLVRLRHRGYPGETVELLLRRDGEEVTRTKVTLEGASGEINVPLTFTPVEVGEFTWQVESLPKPGETVEANNRAAFSARVTGERVRVLYIERTPRWQFRFLRDAMHRDRRLNLHILLTGSEPDPNPPAPFIPALPSDTAALEKYDLFILGDFNPGILSEAQAEAIRNAVRESGAGLLLLAGPVHNPGGFRGSLLEDFLPVETAEAAADPGRPRSRESDAFTPELTVMGRNHPALQLGTTADESAARWSELLPSFWYAPVTRTRPGATVLLQHPQERTDQIPPEPAPLLVEQHYGKGRVIYCGMDETWRWRFKQGDRIFYRFWGQIVQYLGVSHLAAETGKDSLRTDQPIYDEGAVALVTARLTEILGGSLPPLVMEDDAGRQERFTLEPSPGAEFLYEARVPLTRAGQVRLYLEGQNIGASALIEVRASNREFQNPGADAGLMRELASVTGGQAAPLAELGALLAALDLSPVAVEEQRDMAIWDRPWLILMFVLLCGTEWILRRLWHLP